MIKLHKNEKECFVKSLLPTSNKDLLAKAFKKDRYLAGFYNGVLETIERNVKKREDINFKILNIDRELIAKRTDKKYKEGYKLGRMCSLYHLNRDLINQESFDFFKAVMSIRSLDHSAETLEFAPSNYMSLQQETKQQAAAGYFYIYFKQQLIECLESLENQSKKAG